MTQELDAILSAQDTGLRRGSQLTVDIEAQALRASLARAYRDVIGRYLDRKRGLEGHLEAISGELDADSAGGNENGAYEDCNGGLGNVLNSDKAWLDTPYYRDALRRWSNTTE